MSIPFRLLPFHSISTMFISILPLYTISTNSIYPFLPSSSTSFGRIIKHQWYLSLYIISNLFTMLICFQPSHSFRNSVFLLFQPTHNDASQGRKSLFNVLFKGERRVEGNSNALSSLQMSERVILEVER